jgi:16S rRNA G966 N2-methylase RsmD
MPDVVFIDPPYKYTRLYEWIDSLEWNSILSSHGAVFVECGSETVLQKDWNRRKYGDSYLNWKRTKDVR